jgi:hypothetical protein
LATRTEGALGHFLENVVTADGFDLIFFGFFLTVVFLVVVLVAFDPRCMFVFRMLVTVSIFGMRGILFGMSGLKLCILGVIVMRMAILRDGRDRLLRRRRFLDRGRREACRNRLLGLDVGRDDL